MTNTQDGELSYSEDCEKIVDSLLQEFTIRSATIG